MSTNPGYLELLEMLYTQIGWKLRECNWVSQRDVWEKLVGRPHKIASVSLGTGTIKCRVKGRSLPGLA